MAFAFDPFGPRNLYNAAAGEDNIGGLAAVWYTPARNFRSWPALGELRIAALDLIEGATRYQLLSTCGSLSYDQKPKTLPRQGTVQAQKLTGAIPRHAGHGPGAAAGRPVRGPVPRLNGQVQLVGTPAEPLELSYSYSAGTESRRNGYDWTLQGETPRVARPSLGSWLVSERGLELGELQGSGDGSVQLRTASGQLLATVPAGKSIVLKSGFKLGYEIV
ncbi:hypothetical protein F1C16_08005 [Hymenobacter sp. NBH84]|uniref:hypothetical protein n=1 Tax=Hymenobacter sp. NBH84 TaxID=2596915 RepID=UPI001628AEF9|nr:hypothetical protein [Hymenobacter sp. NBH84]QNE39499.1 hypothetical protein F1C16_08005 [Hymenobacter sp. NBH84]